LPNGFFKYLYEKKGNPFDFFCHFVELPAKVNRYWTTFETLAEIKRLCMGDWPRRWYVHL